MMILLRVPFFFTPPPSRRSSAKGQPATGHLLLFLRFLVLWGSVGKEKVGKENQNPVPTRSVTRKESLSTEIKTTLSERNCTSSYAGLWLAAIVLYSFTDWLNFFSKRVHDSWNARWTRKIRYALYIQYVLNFQKQMTASIKRDADQFRWLAPDDATRTSLFSAIAQSETITQTHWAKKTTGPDLPSRVNSSENNRLPVIPNECEQI